MDRKQAQALIKETFESPFDKNRFSGFVKNLLNEIKEAPFIYRGNFIPDAYEQYINTLERVGKYDDGEHKIDILIAKLKKETSIERARTMQRNFIAWYLNGSRGGELKDAALVAFVAPNEEDWRFSLVKMDYKFEEGKKGRMRVKEEFTPARRWSFLVGINENSHTAQSQLVDLVSDDEHNPLLGQLEEAFNIEKVTKEFFEKYRDLFLWAKETLDDIAKKDKKIREDFKVKGVDTVDFSKKLLGQIVFLYFLQKKGWFGVKRDTSWGTGPKNFLRELFEGRHSSYSNFFNDILEPLFYEALARERDDDFYSRFNCKIPFLNGGLFDPINNYDWVHTDILLPNDLFSNNRKTREGDKGNGILDIFDRYNFTVKEDEPLEKEVAVDPEMLGKVFENLLEVKDRKSKGTYYTPREIVHYMCVQSLTNYLTTELEGKVSKDDCEQLIKYGEIVGENEAWVEKKGEETQRYYYRLSENIRNNAKLIDEKLTSIKVCDPAVGSGAFPVGMMTEIVRTRQALSSYIKNPDRTLYSFKWEFIHNSLYGVDIDPSAVEIAKLRLWLSLVVDEDDIREIKPLPNLDYKIMQGNSLLEEYEGVCLFDDTLISAVNFDRAKQIIDLKAKQAALSSECIKLYQMNKLSRGKKQQIDEDLKKINTQIKRLEHPAKKFEENISLFDSYNDAKKKSDELKQLHKQYFETTQKSNKDELKKKIEKLEWSLIETTLKEQGKTSKIKELEDLKKANIKPFFLWKLHFADVFQEKGGFDVVIANPPYIGESGHKDLFRQTKQGHLGKFYLGKMDYFYFFLHLAINLVRQNAQIAFITTNYYLTASGARKLRDDYKERVTIRSLINFNELKIFESAKGQHNMITLLQKGRKEDLPAQTCVTQRAGLADSDVLLCILGGSDNQSNYYSVQQVNLYDGDESYIRLNRDATLEFRSNSNINPILDKMAGAGIPLGQIANIDQGVVSGCDYLSNRNIDKLSANYHSQLGDGIFVFDFDNPRDVAQISKFTKDELRLLKRFFKNSDIRKYWCSNKATKQLLYIGRETSSLKEYPNVLAHLNKFKPILTDRREVQNGRIKYFQLQWPRTASIFTGEKIIVPYRSNNNSFAYNHNEWFCRSDCYVITSKDSTHSLKFLLALLNSKLYFQWFYHRGKRKGEILELFQTPLSEAPIMQLSTPDQAKFISIVDKILLVTNEGDYLGNNIQDTKVKKYKSEIDQMVYDLYELNKDEVAVIESFGKKD